MCQLQFEEHRPLLPRPTYQLPPPAQLNLQLQYQQQYERHHPHQTHFDYIEQSRYYRDMPLVERIAPQVHNVLLLVGTEWYFMPENIKELAIVCIHCRFTGSLLIQVFVIL